MPSLVTVTNGSSGDEILAEHINQLVELLQGLRNIPVSLTGINDAATFGLTVRNAGTGGKGFTVLSSSGSALLAIQDSGVTVNTLTAPHMTAPVVDSGGLTVSAGGLTITAGTLTFGAAASVIVPGATSINFNNNANNATNLTITDAGTVSIGRGALQFTPAVGVVNGGATSLNFNNAANNQTNLTILDGGGVSMPRLGAFVASDHYLVIDASGNIHKSALGPAS